MIQHLDYSFNKMPYIKRNEDITCVEHLYLYIYNNITLMYRYLDYTYIVTYVFAVACMVVSDYNCAR